MDTPVTPGYNLKKQYLPSPAVKDDRSLDQYIDFLKSKGIQVHQSIKPAMFSLSNGLLYPGLKTQKQLSGPHLLVKVPKQMLLTTCTANIPELQKIFEDDFYNNRHFNWEDRIICTFLLYVYATKPEDSVWFHMVNNLSRQIDILTFWPEEDIRFLNDRKVDSICKKVKLEFQRQWLWFTQVIGKHPDVIPEEVVTKENYLWLYTHLVSRSFGKFLKHVTMVPFCELFNHHNSDVLYDFLYNESNPLKPTQTNYESPQLFATESARAQVESSDGSYESQDQIDDNEYDYSQLDIKKIKWGGKVSFDLKEAHTVEVETNYNQLMNWLHTELYWRDFSIMLISQVIERMNIAKNQYMAGRKKFPETMATMTTLKQTCQAFKMKSIEYYKTIKGHRFQYRHLTVPLEQFQQEPIPQNVRFMEDKFDFFTMRMNKRDHFEANNQVYFCYGRLSNRMMLCRYGMALQGNKYDHVWLSLKVIPHIEGYPDTIQQMQEKHLPTRQKFKIKRRQMSLQLVMFVRMTRWDLQRHDVNSIFRVMNYDKEVMVLMECIKLIEDEWRNLGDPKDLEGKLLDKSISYHEYFGTVYQLEHYRILELHLRIFRELLCIIRLIKDGMKTDEAVKPKKGDHEELQLYHYLKPYFNQLVYVK